MARRRKDETEPTIFTTGEVARVTGLPVRSVIYLCDQRLLPSAGGGSLGSHREINVEGLVRAAITGAFYKSGVDVAKAARLVREMTDDDDVGVKIASAGLREVLDAALGPDKRGDFTMPYGVDESEFPFYLHRELKKTKSYKKDTAFAMDHLLHIVNSEHAILSHIEKKDGHLVPANVGGLIFTIKNFTGPSSDIEIKTTVISPENKFSWEKFGSVVSINLSLAARNALDGIADSRQ